MPLPHREIGGSIRLIAHGHLAKIRSGAGRTVCREPAADPGGGAPADVRLSMRVHQREHVRGTARAAADRAGAAGGFGAAVRGNGQGDGGRARLPARAISRLDRAGAGVYHLIAAEKAQGQGDREGEVEVEVHAQGGVEALKPLQRSRNERSGGSAGNSAARFSFIAVTASRTWALLQIAPWIHPICLSASSTEWSRA